MAYTITFVAVVWTSGDTITETKKDQEMANQQAYDSHSSQGLQLDSNVALSWLDSGAVRRELLNLDGSDDFHIGDPNTNLLQFDNVWDSDVQPRVVLDDASDQSISTSSNTAINWDTEIEDVGGLHDNVTNNERITIVEAGFYEVTLSLEFASNATGFRQIGIRQDGATFLAISAAPAVNGSGSKLTTSVKRTFAAVEYVEAMVFQTSGGNLNVTTTADNSTFSAVKLA